ncbi:MAG: NAD+ synthetase [Verrucomicrobium sp.]|nr:NAD+ synthetase [Verrucomicrobium sp.]
MKPITVAAVSLNQTPLDWSGNRNRIRQALREARQAGASVVCLPELSLTGYGCEDAFHARGTHEAALRLLEELLPDTKGLVVSLGLPLLYKGALFNTVCLVVDGIPAGLVAKRFLAGDGIHYEPRWFKPWPEGVRKGVSLAGHEVPLGDLLFEIGGVRIGFEICEDAWVAARPGARLALRGIDLILNPSASHFAFGKLRIRERFVLEGSRAFNASYVYSNLTGNESGRAIYDGGSLIASGGSLVARGPRLSYRDVVVTTATLDIDATRMSQARTASYRPHIEPGEDDAVRIGFAWPAPPSSPATSPFKAEAWEDSPRLKEEEFTRAVALGLFDYLRKSRLNGFVVSLSGGGDSSAIVCLVRQMVDLAILDIGLDGLREKLAYIPGIAGASNARSLTRLLLATAYQATEHSSEETRAAAQAIAGEAGATHLELDIAPLVDSYTRLVSAGLGQSLSWEDDGPALQKIQSRVRSPGIWLVADLRRAILLSSSNRSEAAVGHATVDGDTSGGLSPIAGIDKAFLRQWLRWVETEGPRGIGPLPALAAVNRQPPAAELRPAEDSQADEDDLMPYPVLDSIEKAAIRDKLAPVECYHRLRREFPARSAGETAAWVDRFFRLWCRNQWKRERYAPSLHLDDENLDPKTWCRFPILCGGFEEELEELRKTVQSQQAELALL